VPKVGGRTTFLSHLAVAPLAFTIFALIDFGESGQDSCDFDDSGQDLL